MKKIMYLAVLLTALLSCSKEQDIIEPMVETSLESGELIATAKDFVYAGATKTTITQEGSNPPSFAWKEGDVIGIIPMNNETVQSNYKVVEIGANPREASFDGGVWALKEGKEYAAYYPYQYEAVPSGSSLSFSFTGQTQSANNSLAHLGAYDYMYASAVAPAAGKAQFNFEHKVSLVRLQLTVPEAGTYKKVVLEAFTPWFATSASLRLSDGVMSATETQKSATVALGNISVAAGDVLTVWFAMLPTSALNGKTLIIKLNSKNETFTGEISVPGNITAGHAYTYTSTLIAHEYVDLGLSVKWASCNLGADSPEQYGGYYQWAGTQDVSSTSINLDWSNCPYHTGSSSTSGWTKYIPSSQSSYWSGTGSPDNKTVRDPDDDVAHVTLGGKWRMPTDAEWTELQDNCTRTWTDDYKGTGIHGYIVTSNKSGYTDKSIFLPAAGYRVSDRVDIAGSHGVYWSSSLDPGSPDNASIVYFNSSDVYSHYVTGRCDGLSVRPVSE